MKDFDNKSRSFLKNSLTTAILSLTLFLTCLLLPATALAWPTTAQWLPVYRNGVIIQDSNTDTNGSRNIVSDATHAAEFYFNDGTYIYFRLRLDQDPTGQGGQGLLKPYGWGMEIDANQNPSDYEWLILVDGISQNETITLQQNTIQGTLGDPGDRSEIMSLTLPLLSNYQVNTADTSFNADQDYFLDWRFPYSTFKQLTNIADNSPIRLFGGSSSSANSLTENGADLVGASDLYAGFSDYMTPFGTALYTGTVRFVADLAGSGDVTQIIAGETIFIRVDDQDRNYDYTTKQTFTVTLTAPSGDTETVTLTETGLNTGIFTGSITSTASPTVQTYNGIMQVMSGETVTVTYIDPIDANRNLNQAKTDTLLVQPPVISISKSVAPSSVTAGGTVTYTITLTNSGNGDGWLTYIIDNLPAGFTYIPGTTSGLTTSDPSINGQQLTWSGSWTVPKKNGAINGTATLSFQAVVAKIPGEHKNQVSAVGSNFGPYSSGPTAPVIIKVPAITISKSVDKEIAAPGEEIIYTIYIKNLGDASASTVAIVDSIPMHTTFVTGSLRTGGATSTYATANIKTDGAGDDEAELNGSSVIFRVGPFTANDFVPGAGNDEGKCFFKVKIN